MNGTIIYEQPLNEIMRVSLRLEQLFQQIDHQLHDHSVLASRNTVMHIINILQLLDRPDLKAKLAKELSQHLSHLKRYNNVPDIDAEKLKELTEQLNLLSHTLIESSGKIGQKLRDLELLNALRLHLASPGGACHFDTPLYHFWLQQSSEKRQETIHHWLKEFDQIKKAVHLALDLIRKNAKIENKTAVHGFHQELLDPQSNLRMIRIGIDEAIKAYPEISIGRHFLSARFFMPDIQKRPSQFNENLSFWMAYCHL